ncbi:MAG: 3-oxoacyl-ACP reductase FabG [Chloroflexi bacterium]|nr:3-oxoacyl-ACP reductase FabG [Chloroflexota bacterium]MBV9600414.1 3-oxoacyl-ACP reductase FabG [Chloroflexota bacterium]
MNAGSRLSGRVAIVTGGGHGIGRAYCHALASQGAGLVVAEIDAEAARKTAEDLMEFGHDALGISTDVSLADSVGEMVARATEHFGHVDVLVNNAAVFASVPMSRTPIEDISVDEWDRMMAVNLRGMFLVSRAVVPGMKERRWGRIINISSGRALSNSANSIHYVTSKAGVLGFTRTLAREVGAFGITVNAIAPGSTLSEDNPSDEIIQMRSNRVEARAIPRLQVPEDLIGAVVFFASDDAAFITGQTLVVDGGATMH